MTMQSFLTDLVERETDRILNEGLFTNNVEITSGLRVHWYYTFNSFGRTIKGHAYGVMTGKYGKKLAEVKLQSNGPKNQAPGTKIKVSIEKLRTVDGNERVIRKSESDANIARAERQAELDRRRFGESTTIN